MVASEFLNVDLILHVVEDSIVSLFFCAGSCYCCAFCLFIYFFITTCDCVIVDFLLPIWFLKIIRTAKLLDVLRSRVNVGWDLESEEFIVVKQ